MNISSLMRLLIKDEVEDIIYEISRDNSKQIISNGKWQGKLFNPGGSGQPTSRIVYKIFYEENKTTYEVYGNIDGWFLDVRNNIYGPFKSPEEALSEIDSYIDDQY